MSLNKECKRELVAATIYNLFVVLVLIALRYFKVFDLIGIKPEIEIAIWVFAGIYILASFISVGLSYKFMYRK